jgi:hypothetical protein
LDEAMGMMGQRPWTLGVQEAVSLLSCDCGFATVSDLMKRLFGVGLAAPTIQDVAEEAGARAADLLDAPYAVQEVPDTLIIAADGCQTPQRDGWHEAKLATIYPKAARCSTPGGRGRLLRKEYVATLENAEGFGERLWRRAEGWSVDQVRRLVVMGDGAAWIWNLSALHFPQATEIVDFYHAVEHLWDVGEALWGDRQTSTATRSWVRRYRKRLRDGRVDLVLAAIERSVHQQKRLSAEREKTVRLNVGYFQRNAHRMRYSRFRQMGLPIGTGAVEGACKHVIESRFKRPGCRWTPRGLKRMLALRLLRLNNRWEQLWPHLTAA